VLARGLSLCKYSSATPETVPSLKMKGLPKWKATPASMVCAVALVVFFGVFLTHRTGALQFLEFYVYDFFIRHEPKAATSDPVVLVEMTEDDINNRSLDYPIGDDALAELLRDLEADQPAVIGLDIYRDVPVPKDGVGWEELNQVLLTHSNIVAIFTLGGGTPPPPPVLKSNLNQIAFNDNYLTDAEVDSTVPKVRRAMLFVSTSSGRFDSLPYRLVLQYLQGKGIAPVRERRSVRLGKARFNRWHKNDGAYVNIETAPFQILMDFKCPNQFTRYTMIDVLTGQVPAGSLRGKIVIVGVNARSVPDTFATPISPGLRGIELHAMTVNQLLRRVLEGETGLQFWSQWMKDAWLLLWCAAGAVAGCLVRSLWRVMLLGALGLAGLGIAGWSAFSNNWWIPITTPALGYLPAIALGVAYVSTHERSMRNILMKLYSRHVSKEIAEAIWQHRDSFLAGKRPLEQKLVVTVLFTDLKGFSTLAEEMEPARLYKWLNSYFGAMAAVIQDHGGVLKQFTGDGILALFGVPVPRTTRAEQSSDAVAAVTCALCLGRRLVQLSEDWKASGLPSVSMRAGIYTGEVAAGSIGSDDRFEYAVIGDVVNTASRLEGYDKSVADPDLLPNRCRILIGAPTQALLDGKFLSKEIGLLEVKGKTNKVAVFQVLS
jgi:adenylate cyclase